LFCGVDAALELRDPPITSEPSADAARCRLCSLAGVASLHVGLSDLNDAGVVANERIETWLVKEHLDCLLMTCENPLMPVPAEVEARMAIVGDDRFRSVKIWKIVS
jgi:hypothetical protein